MDQQSLERIRKRKRDDDDELFFSILPALYLYLKNTEKTKRHSSITYGRRKVRRLLNGHLKDCLTAFRMEPEIFRWIASYLRTEGLISDSDTIKVEEKLAFFLYMLSHNASYEDLQVAFQHSASTFHDYINEFFDVVPILASRFLRPRHIDGPHSKIANDDRFFPYFENCLGAIDGSHVPVTRSPQLQAPWRNRKGSLSQNLMLACDFDLNVTFISCGWEGSATDARVLSSALLNGFNVPNGKFYLVDGGYANTQHFLAPYRGVRYHLKEWGHGHHAPQNHMELFNYRHAVARNHIERLIGILKKRFPILNVGTFHSITNQVKIPAAAAVFHNIIKLQDGDEEWLEDQEDNIDPAVFVDLPNGDGENIQENQLHENHVLGNQWWSSETWNVMVKLFLSRHPYLRMEKSQIQDKEKDLKRDYRMLKEARMQSGVGWDESQFKLQAEPHLWENLEISFGTRIKRFKTKAFPLYDSLGQLYEGSIAEGNFNFTSTSTTSREDLTQVISDDDEPEGDTEADIPERESEDEYEVMDPAPSAQSMTQVEHQVKGKRVAAARNKLPKIPKRSPKKRNSDGIVQVMERMVQVREKEVNQEQPLQKFSITRCMDALKTLDGMTGSIKIPALDVFRIADNREIFLNLVDDKDDKDGTAMTWLLGQIAKLP